MREWAITNTQDLNGNILPKPCLEKGPQNAVPSISTSGACVVSPQLWHRSEICSVLRSLYAPTAAACFSYLSDLGIIAGLSRPKTRKSEESCAPTRKTEEISDARKPGQLALSIADNFEGRTHLCFVSEWRPFHSRGKKT